MRNKDKVQGTKDKGQGTKDKVLSTKYKVQSDKVSLQKWHFLFARGFLLYKTKEIKKNILTLQ